MPLPPPTREDARAPWLRFQFDQPPVGSEAHRRWLESLMFDNEIDRVVVDEYKLAIDQVERRLRALDREIEKAAQLPALSRARGVAALFPRRRYDDRDDLHRRAPRHRALSVAARARRVSRVSFPASTPAASPRDMARSRRRATATSGALSSRRRGSTSNALGATRSSRPDVRVNPSA